MNGKVQGVYMNLRYRVLTINDQSYILDMGNSFWKILFPFFYWILPNTAYKVDDPELIDKIKSPKVKNNNAAKEGVLAGLIGVSLANLLQPIVSFFDIEGTTVVNSIIVSLVLFIVLSVFFYINVRSKKSLSKLTDLKKYSTVKLFVRPQSRKHYFNILFAYLVFLAFTFLCWGGFIQIANAIILFGGMVFFFLALFSSALVYELGENKVAFKDDKKKAV